MGERKRVRGGGGSMRTTMTYKKSSDAIHFSPFLMIFRGVTKSQEYGETDTALGRDYKIRLSIPHTISPVRRWILTALEMNEWSSMFHKLKWMDCLRSLNFPCSLAFSDRRDIMGIVERNTKTSSRAPTYFRFRSVNTVKNRPSPLNELWEKTLSIDASLVEHIAYALSLTQIIMMRGHEE